MKKTIKIKSPIKDIKVFNRSINSADQIKCAFIKTKGKAEHGLYSDENSSTEYASNHISHTAEKIGQKAVGEFDWQGWKAIRTTKHNILKVNGKIQGFREQKSINLLKEKTIKQAQGSVPQGIQTAKKITAQYSQTIVKTMNHGGKAIKGSAKTMKSTAKGTIKTAHKSVKTAERTSKMTVKTTQMAAKSALKTAKATAKSTRSATQIARTLAKTTVAATKAIIKATISALKAIIAGTKLLISAIIAGGWIAVMILIIICMVGLLAGSSFGIFFSSEGFITEQNIQAVVREINQEYNTRLDNIKAENTHEVLEMSGSRAIWPEVLSVYAILITTNPDNPQEVATMNDYKKGLLKSIFWEMHEINHRTESKTLIETSDDGNGNIVETSVTITREFLYISISHKSAEDMAAKYSFKPNQRNQLAELLSDKNSGLWSAVLYGVSAGNDDIVKVALSQVGNVGGQLYWSWYGFGSPVEWCACFVSWCANECGYIEAGIIPKFAACTSQGVPWFKERGQWQDNSYIPSPGDIIFFDWEGDGSADHVGIVEKCEDGVVYTVEGNSRDTCRQRSYAVGSSVIYGYGVLCL